MSTAPPAPTASPSTPPLYHPADMPTVCTAYSLTPDDLTTLLAYATAAKHNAYCPYSQFRVGASVLTTEGDMFTGANVENASYPVGTCAERVALGKAVVTLGTLGTLGVNQEDGEEVMPFTRWKRGEGIEGENSQRKFSAMVVVTDGESPASPCGMCRQFIREFCDLDMPIFMFDWKGDFHVLTLGELLPVSFGPEALGLTV